MMTGLARSHRPSTLLAPNCEAKAHRDFARDDAIASVDVTQIVIKTPSFRGLPINVCSMPPAAALQLQLVQQPQQFGHARAAVEMIADDDHVPIAKRPVQFCVDDFVRLQRAASKSNWPCTSLKTTRPASNFDRGQVYGVFFTHRDRVPDSRSACSLRGANEDVRGELCWRKSTAPRALSPGKSLMCGPSLIPSASGVVVQVWRQVESRVRQNHRRTSAPGAARKRTSSSAASAQIGHTHRHATFNMISCQCAPGFPSTGALQPSASANVSWITGRTVLLPPAALDSLSSNAAAIAAFW